MHTCLFYAHMAFSTRIYALVYARVHFSMHIWLFYAHLPFSMHICLFLRTYTFSCSYAILYEYIHPSMLIYICLCTYAFFYAHRTFLCSFVFFYAYMSFSMHIYIFMLMYHFIWMYASFYACMHFSLHVCSFLCTYTFFYAHISSSDVNVFLFNYITTTWPTVVHQDLPYAASVWSLLIISTSRGNNISYLCTNESSTLQGSQSGSLHCTYFEIVESSSTSHKGNPKYGEIALVKLRPNGWMWLIFLCTYT